MGKHRPAPTQYVQPYRYPSPHIPLSAIKRFARRIAEKFRPVKIILFGSYAYGQPHEESDVDLLVIMPTRDALAQSVRIDLAFERPFSLDVIVRTLQQMERDLRPGDCNWFLREIVDKGIVLYEAIDAPVGAQRPKRTWPRPEVWPRNQSRFATRYASTVSRRPKSIPRRCCKNSDFPCHARTILRTFLTCCCRATQRCNRCGEVSLR
jgi:predicted nucleotidyltransferase